MRNDLHPLVGKKLRSASSDLVFEGVLDVGVTEWLSDHRFYDMAIFPAAGYMESILAVGSILDMSSPQVEDLELFGALALDEERPTVFQIILTSLRGGGYEFRICSISASGYEADGDWQTHATGKLKSGEPYEGGAEDLGGIAERCSEEISTTELYEEGRKAGVEYRDLFQGLRWVGRTEGEALGKVELPSGLKLERDRYQLHPVLLDSGFQLMAAALHGSTEDELYMPVGVDSHRVYGHPSSDEITAHVVVRSSEEEVGEAIAGDIRLFDSDGSLISETANLHFRRVSREALMRSQRVDVGDWIYAIDWQATPLEGEVDVATAGYWIVFSDDSGVGASLVAELTERGDTCLTVTGGDAYHREGLQRATLRVSEPSDYKRLFQEVGESSEVCRGVIYLWPLMAEMPDETTLQALESDYQLVCGPALSLVQGLVSSDFGEQPRLWLVTRGSHLVGSQRERVVPVQSSLWGLGAVIALEHPLLGCSRVDLDPQDIFGLNASRLCDEVCSASPEDQIAFRANSRYVARLTRDGAERGSIASTMDMAQAYELDISERGVLDNLRLVPLQRTAPEAGQVEIEIHATGLNFRDVLNALGTYAGEAGPLGSECAGRIVSVGEGVEGLAVGDEVVALSTNTFASHITCDNQFVLPIPPNLSMAEAATIPITFLTSEYALRHCASIRKGQRVLIHAGAGGVGMAAIQIAQSVGAEIFATAGNPRKRALLRSFGVTHVMDSRSLDFADQIMEVTSGKGVDIVLNSLNGEFIPKSVSVLSEGGHFLEIGKAGIWEPDRFAKERPDAKYDIIFLGESIRDEPDLIRKMFIDLMDNVKQGILKPLPRHDFPISKTIEAFRFMAAAKHIGKVVIHRDVDDHTTWQRGSADPLSLEAEASYLITGGLGGLGFETAKFFAGNGAKNLVLVGRSAPKEEISLAIQELRDDTVSKYMLAR